jgi:hypothetical protein
MSSINQKNINIKTFSAVRDFTMGADPELIIKQGTEILNKHILQEGDEFGIDGNGVLFEARPDPDLSPLAITQNIRGIFVRQCLRNPKHLDYDWFAGSAHGGYTLGGHIHFGIKEDVIAPLEATRILSQYVGAITMLLEDTEQGKIRRRHKGGPNQMVGYYGHIEDWRPQSFGFEYRTPASWITSPYVTAAVLCLAKVVMYEVVNNDKFKVPKRVQPQHFLNMETDSERTLFPEIWAEITRMALYKQYAPYINLLYYLVNKKVNNNTTHVTWFPKCSMKAAWGVVNSQQINRAKVQSEALWHKFNQRNALVAKA